MSVVMAPRILPLSPDGAAGDVSLPDAATRLSDRTGEARFGIKGPGSAAWLERQAGPLPAVNGIGRSGDLRVLRLGGEDLLVTGPGCEALADAWRRAEGPRGYWSWREEGWAWLRLDGPDAGDVMARLCAVDLRPGRFPPSALAQTRVAGLEAVVVPEEGGFDLFFDIASTAFMVRSLAAAAERADRAAGRPARPGRGG